MEGDIHFIEKLGRGGYGSVYKCRDDRGHIFAAKKIRNDENGITCLMELAVMTTFNHPHINSLHRIHMENKEVYIFMPLAQTDFDPYHYNKFKKESPRGDQLKYWCFSLLEALHALHREDIIHCDIKGGNVLLYDNSIVKLSDFTLARKKWKKDEKFQHLICTCTHRPPEVFLGKEWDESVDIWSLACTFYEIAYGRLLFPLQSKDEQGETKIIFNQTFNSILDWMEQMGNPIPIKKKETPFTPVDSSLIKQESEFNRLLLSMLKWDPKERPNTSQLLQHPYFEGMKLSPYYLNKRVVLSLPDSDYLLFETVAYTSLKYKVDEIILDLGKEIYKRCCNKLVIAPNLIILGCLHIATKLLGLSPLDFGLNYRRVLETEKAICNELSFRFIF